MTRADYVSLALLGLSWVALGAAAWVLAYNVPRKGPARPLGGTLDASNAAAAPRQPPRPISGPLAAVSDDARLTPRDTETRRVHRDLGPGYTHHDGDCPCAVSPAAHDWRGWHGYRQRVQGRDDDAGAPWGAETDC